MGFIEGLVYILAIPSLVFMLLILVGVVIELTRMVRRAYSGQRYRSKKTLDRKVAVPMTYTQQDDRLITSLTEVCDDCGIPEDDLDRGVLLSLAVYVDGMNIIQRVHLVADIADMSVQWANEGKISADDCSHMLSILENYMAYLHMTSDETYADNKDLFDFMESQIQDIDLPE